MEVFINNPAQIDGQLDQLKRMLHQSMVPDSTGHIRKVVVKADFAKGKQRTATQNNALHLYLTQLAKALNDGGLDQRSVLSADYKIPWTTDSAKEHLWRPIQRKMYKTNSTTELDVHEIQEVYEALNRAIADRLGLSIPWPTIGDTYETER